MDGGGAVRVRDIAFALRGCGGGGLETDFHRGSDPLLAGGHGGGGCETEIVLERFPVLHITIRKKAREHRDSSKMQVIYRVKEHVIEGKY